MSGFVFRPSARLQKYLGRELIADPNLAILEFVKNAYDAGATEVFIDFCFPSGEPSFLVISDNGHGMDETSFEINWMHPGYSEKALGSRGAKSTARSKRRVPVGEKGLGRLAAGRLGEVLEVFTRTSKRESWLHVYFDWANFDNMAMYIDEIEIEHDYETLPVEPKVTAGTILVIRDLELNWDGRMRGRPVPGRKRTRLGRLKQDLELLVRPLKPTDPTFTIYLDSELFLNEDDVGAINPTAAIETADYIYTFEFRQLSKGKVSVHRAVERSDALIEELGGDKSVRFKATDLSEVAGIERRPADLECGPFKGQFLYSPPPAAKRAKEIEAIGSGVLLYRDSMLVEPYGIDGNDWVGVTARKAQRQGYALVQPNLFSGYVLITRGENPQLRDMSNRQGLLESEASETFIQHVRAEFSHFESIVFEELTERWQTKEARAAREAAESIDLAAVRLRAIAHSLGQPLFGLGADIAAIKIVAGRDNVPKEVATQLTELSESASDHLRQAQESLGRFRDVPVTERSAVSVDDLVEQAVRVVKPLAKSVGATIRVKKMPRHNVFVHRELVVEAIAELLRNGLEAPRSSSLPKEVGIDYRDTKGDAVLEIWDNGQGMAGGHVEGDLTLIDSTKGRPGVGLATVAEIVAASRGRVQVAGTSAEGTRIVLMLPELLRGLHST